MAKITVLGGTGYAGSAIVNEAAARGHEVTSVSRHAPASIPDRVRHAQGSATDDKILAAAVRDTDVIIAAMSPRGDMAGKIPEVYRKAAVAASAEGARFIVIGGFGSLRPAEGAPRFAEAADFIAEYKDEALELIQVLDTLLADSPDTLDWLYVSPAAEFGAYNPGDKKGQYRISGTIASFDEAGNSQLSGADLA